MNGRKRYILLSYRFLEEDGQIASLCDELGLASYGKDIDAARAGLEEAISAVLNTLDERGEVWDYLEVRGIRVFEESEEPVSKTFTNLTLRVGESISTARREVVAAGSA